MRCMCSVKESGTPAGAPGSSRSTPLLFWASTDWMRAFADQIRPWVDRPYVVLGTDGYGRSDTRASLRRFFEIDRYHIVVAALYALAQEGDFEMSAVSRAIREFGLDPELPAPWTV